MLGAFEYLMQTPLQHSGLFLQKLSRGRHGFLPASALFASPKQASAMPARPTPNFFSACRRVADWANPLANSSNLLFIFLAFVWFVLCAYLGCGALRSGLRVGGQHGRVRKAVGALVGTGGILAGKPGQQRHVDRVVSDPVYGHWSGVRNEELQHVAN